jgi:putative transposase
MDLRHGRHCVFALHAYLVFVTKHRRGVLTAGALLEAGDVEDENVHLLVSYPPHVSVRYFRGTLWTPSYFAAAAGGVTLEKVKKYVEEQRASSPAGMPGLQRGDFDEMTPKPRVYTPGH